MVFAIVVWSICTALTPTAAELGNVPIISVRVLLGAGEGEIQLFSERSHGVLLFFGKKLLMNIVFGSSHTM